MNRKFFCLDKNVRWLFTLPRKRKIHSSIVVFATFLLLSNFFLLVFVWTTHFASLWALVNIINGDRTNSWTIHINQSLILSGQTFFNFYIFFSFLFLAFYLFFHFPLILLFSLFTLVWKFLSSFSLPRKNKRERTQWNFAN